MDITKKKDTIDFMDKITDSTTRQQLIEKLKDIFLFRYLNDNARATLGEHVDFFKLQQEELIVTEGEKSPYFFVVMEGSVNVTTGSDEKTVFLGCLGAGEVFGEAAVFLKMPRTATVSSADETIIMQLHRDQFVEFVRRLPRAGNTVLLVMIHSLLRKLRDTNQELAFERKLDSDQGDIDAMIAGFMDGDEDI